MADFINLVSIFFLLQQIKGLESEGSSYGVVMLIIGVVTMTPRYSNVSKIVLL